MTKEIKRKLVKNYEENAAREENEQSPVDHVPVLKLFGGANCTWVLSEYCPESDTLFGLCDLGMGFPEVGYVSFAELKGIRFKPFGLPIERDRHFSTDKTISQLADEARKAERITV